jgi:hypothetical protein
MDIDDLDNRDLNETDCFIKVSVDPMKLFANACANHSETLCGVIINALLTIKDESESDVEAVVDIIKALHAE